MKAETELYPLILEPAYKDYIWGGSRIPALFNRVLPPGTYAESWELSDRPEGMSHVANGYLKGESLAALISRFGRKLLGSSLPPTRFPLLVKLIDARELLSVQVHPDDAHAARGDGEAKTEAWHILDAPDRGKVFAGLKGGTTEASFLDALNHKQLKRVLRSVTVSAGDTVFIPGGRVHAIAEGLLILEVQQNSNTTYRVHDWDRVDKLGKPRQLHLEQALRVIQWEDTHPVKIPPRIIQDKPGTKVIELVGFPYFLLEKIETTVPFFVQHSGSSFHALFTGLDEILVMSTAGVQPIPAGRTCLIPASLDRYTIKPAGKGATILRISVPSRPDPAPA
jgi:mannose-6-phosphate isomerase